MRCAHMRVARRRSIVYGDLPHEAELSRAVTRRAMLPVCLAGRRGRIQTPATRQIHS